MSPHLYLLLMSEKLEELRRRANSRRVESRSTSVSRRLQTDAR